MKRILVPCDFSPPAIEAFKFAASIAADSGGAVWLLHAHELPVLHDFESVKGFESKYRGQLRDIADKNFERVKIKVPFHVKVNTVVDFGTLGRAMTKSIKTVKPDLIVVGTHGASGLKELMVGSNAERIVRSSPVPVITVRRTPRLVEDIVLAFRPDRDSPEMILQVKKLQNFFRARLHLVYVNTPTHFMRDAQVKPMMKLYAKQAAFKDHTINTVSDLYEADGIIHFASEIGADMVAMRTHGRRGFAHLANGSIAENVVNHINCPIWTYKVED
jgi:nucleotide-binding universal stress UspA family protein